MADAEAALEIRSGLQQERLLGSDADAEDSVLTVELGAVLGEAEGVAAAVDA